MTRYQYDEEASQRLHMDVVHEIDDAEPVDPHQWVEAMRRLNSIDDPLARKIVALHRDCGSGDGVATRMMGRWWPADRTGDAKRRPS